MNDKKEASGDNSSYKIVALNRKAKFEYVILETFEAGLVLQGCEIKTVRRSGVNISDSYIRPFPDGLYLVNANFSPYSEALGIYREYDPLRPRKLLLHKREIAKLRSAVTQKGLTIIPLDVHLKRGFAKIKLALAKGKLNPDKRQSIKEREQKKKLDRAIKYSRS
jgi:SsrA-binding protein